MTGTDDVVIRPARPDEADELSALALRSKAYWGYSQEFLDACRDELTCDPKACADGNIVVAEIRSTGVVAGFFTLAGTPPHGELSSLFVDRDRIGSGIGGILLNAALREGSVRGFQSLVLDADPGAESFYARFGARRIGEVPSGSIPGRVLPHMEFVLDLDAVQ